MNKFTGTILTIPKMSGNVGAKTINIGDKGDDGATFIPSVSDSGIISWTNDKDLPNPEPVNIKGKDGKDGVDGYTPKKNVDYFDGKDGADGITPHIGANGNWFVGTTDTGKPSRGADGQNGNDGKDGAQGEQGIQGVRGEKGDKGDQGNTGERGPQGPEGQPGMNGVSPVVSVTDISGGHRITIQDAKGTKYIDVLDGKNGSDGQPGEKGETGPEGPQGPQGPQGQTGPEGPQGIQGEPGEKGEQGIPGEKGESGVYILSAGETIEDAPADADVVIDPNGEAVEIPEGGGGADLLNENGTIKQQYLPDGFPYKDGKVMPILTNAKPVDMGEGQFAFLETIELVDGRTYTVNWNGTEYECICKYITGEADAFYVLGFIGVLTGDTSDGVEFPFVIAAVPPEYAAEAGVGGLVMPLDGSTDITLSISGFVGTIQKIDPVFLPDSDTVVISVPWICDSSNSGKLPMHGDEILELIRKGKNVIIRGEDVVVNRIEDYRFVSYDNGFITFQYISFEQGRLTSYVLKIYGDEVSKGVYNHIFEQ